MISWEWVSLDEVDSTNSYAKQHCATLAHGSIITAKRQTLGRGRRGNGWAPTQDGSALAMSVLLKNLTPPQASLLPVVCAVAVCRALSEICLHDCMIKWPNDILLDNRKACGILCESIVGGDSFCVVCGIGVNLTQPRSYFDENNLPHATSVAAQTGKLCSSAQAAAAIAEQLADLLDTLMSTGFASIREEYRACCINIGREVLIHIDGAQHQAKAVDIADNGNLVCEADGRHFLVNAGEASVRGLYGYV